MIHLHDLLLLLLLLLLFVVMFYGGLRGCWVDGCLSIYCFCTLVGPSAPLPSQLGLLFSLSMPSISVSQSPPPTGNYISSSISLIISLCKCMPLLSLKGSSQLLCHFKKVSISLSFLFLPPSVLVFPCWTMNITLLISLIFFPFYSLPPHLIMNI